MTRQGHWIVVSAAIGLIWCAGNDSGSFAQNLTPAEAVQKMTVGDGLEVQRVASEPLVRQPVCIEFDDRGRLWVIQYLQYPNPEGLTRVQVDRFSRTRYDRIPEPPPHGPRGADRITILTDSDSDGVMDQGHDFLNGLNLTTGLAFGHGGVFILNVPYLLFVPDRNRDDIPDGDPEVLLSGFGMEDAHSVANSLTWGPDGWLYGCQGSTVTANVRGIEFQQGVWRYHPVTREFELFCEGGGNTWGLDFDETGRLFYSTNYGGFVLVHGVQGGYFVKAFAKHGALHNPYAYGYFDHAPHRNFTGGHVTVGGIVYQGDAFPDSWRGSYIAGDLLGHAVHRHRISSRGSTVETAHGDSVLLANDPWFATTDVTTGPDGAVYVADWHDSRTAHPDPDAQWDRSNGRIYRIAPPGTRPAVAFDLTRLDVSKLLTLLDHRNQWFVRRARQELIRRNATELIPVLTDRAENGFDQVAAIEALWTLHGLGGFNEELALRLLESPHAAVRSWTVRLLGDAQEVTVEMAHRLDELAEQEPSVEVRQQIAATAARLPAKYAVPMINANINRDIDNDDPFLPLMWWWAVEKHSVSEREEVMKRFVRPSLWKSQLGRTTLLKRLVRRYTAESTQEGLECVIRLLNAAPEDSARDQLWEDVLAGWRDTPRGEPAEGRAFLSAARELSQMVANRQSMRPDDLTLLQLGIAMGQVEALAFAMAGAADSSKESAWRAGLLQIAAPAVDDSELDDLLSLTADSQPEIVRHAAIHAVSRLDRKEVTERLVSLQKSAGPESLRNTALSVLLRRRSSAKAWLAAVDRGEIPAKSATVDQVRSVAILEDPELNALVAKHWGQLQSATTEEKLAEVRRLNNDLRASAGDPTAGQLLFRKHCASCHQLFGEGTKIGPDLTTANRMDRDFLLISLVDPNSVIRKEFVSVIVQTTDGRLQTGMAVARDDSGITLVNAKNERTTVSIQEIEELRESDVSLMPADLYRQLTPAELRDLFAWIQAPGPSLK